MPDLESKTLQAAIVAAVQSSVQGALGTLRGDVAQLDAKLGSWWAQHEQARSWHDAHSVKPCIIRSSAPMTGAVMCTLA